MEVNRDERIGIGESRIKVPKNNGYREKGLFQTGEKPILGLVASHVPPNRDIIQRNICRQELGEAAK